jgi:uncharacterized membrane-anchored protein
MMADLCTRRGRVLAILLVCFAAFAARAQDEEGLRLPFQEGRPGTPIGEDLAEIDLGSDYVYLDAEGTRQFMEATQNPVGGSEVATILPTQEGDDWFLVFEFDDIGYVSDEEKDSLDADAMLASIREGNEAANEERRKRGWGTMSIVGWQEEPFYDATTNNLTWSIIGESEGGRSVNRIIKLLGRRGVMTVTLVSGPEGLDQAAATTDTLLANYRYIPGQTYAEYVPGTDKLATYGLTALVVGGGAAALVKSGLLARLWKPIAVFLAAIGAGIKRMFGSGRSSDHDAERPIG